MQLAYSAAPTDWANVCVCVCVCVWYLLSPLISFIFFFYKYLTRYNSPTRYISLVFLSFNYQEDSNLPLVTDVYFRELNCEYMDDQEQQMMKQQVHVDL